jgi:PGF-CTERM protein
MQRAGREVVAVGCLLVLWSLAGTGPAVALPDGAAVGTGEDAAGSTSPGVVDAAPGALAQADQPNVTIFVAPGSDLGVLQAANASSQYQDVRFTNRQQVTRLDAFVVEVSAPGLDEAVSSQPGDTLTQQFSVLVRSNQASLLGPEAMNDPAATPKVLNLYDPETVTVVDAGNDTYHLVYDPTGIRGTADRNGNDRPDDTEQTRMESGDVFTVNFTFEGSSTEQGFAYFPATAEFTSTPDEERPVFYPLSDHRIAGETTVAPGSTVTVEFTSTGDRTFQQTRTATTTGVLPAAFEATFNLSEAPPGEPVEVLVKQAGETLGATEGDVRPLDARLVAPTRSETSSQVRLDSVNLTKDGIIVARSGGPDGPVVGSRFLRAGEYVDFTMLMDRAVSADSVHLTAVVDVDEDRQYDASAPDRPFTVAGQPVTATIAVPGTGTTPTATTPATTTAERTTASRTTTRPSSTTADTQDTGGQGGTTFTEYTVTDSGGPGFGVPVALVGLLVVVAFLARRRGP